MTFVPFDCNIIPPEARNVCSPVTEISAGLRKPLMIGFAPRSRADSARSMPFIPPSFPQSVNASRIGTCPWFAEDLRQRVTRRRRRWPWARRENPGPFLSLISMQRLRFSQEDSFRTCWFNELFIWYTRRRHASALFCANDTCRFCDRPDVRAVALRRMPAFR